MSNTATTTTPPVQQATADMTAVAGRGTIYISIAKVWFMVSGYGIYFALPRLLSTEQFGLYQVVISFASIVNAVVVTGTYQTISKYVSQEQHKADSVKLAGLKLQILVGGGISLAFFLSAPLLAWYMKDPRLLEYFRIASAITLFYSFYSVFAGYFNGQKKFLAQAGLDMTYSTLKVVFIVALAWLGYGVAGSVAGFALAAAGVLAISALVAGKGDRKGDVKPADLFRFQAYLLLSILVINSLQKADVILVKALSPGGVEAASRAAGLYGGAVNVANITYQLIISISFVIFPLVSEATFREERERTAVYISNTVRYTLMIMAGVATIFSANAIRILRIIYPSDYQAGAAALVFLAYAAMFYGLLYVMTTIISASGRPLLTLSIAAIALAADVAMDYALIPARGIQGAAIGATIAMVVAVTLSGAYLKSKYGRVIPPLPLVRIIAASAVVYGLSLFIPLGSKVLSLAELAVLPVVYAVVLIVLGELGKTELAALKKIVKG